MSTMITFYARLNHTPEIYDPYFQGLRQLTTANRDQLVSLNTGWDPWTADA